MSLTNQDLNAIAQLIDTKLQPLTDRIDKMQGDFNALKNGQQTIRQELRQVSAKVDDTYNVALDAWGQSTENRNLITASN